MSVDEGSQWLTRIGLSTNKVISINEGKIKIRWALTVVRPEIPEARLRSDQDLIIPRSRVDFEGTHHGPNPNSVISGTKVNDKTSFRSFIDRKGIIPCSERNLQSVIHVSGRGCCPKDSTCKIHIPRDPQPTDPLHLEGLDLDIITFIVGTLSTEPDLRLIAHVTLGQQGHQLACLESNHISRRVVDRSSTLMGARHFIAARVKLVHIHITIAIIGLVEVGSISHKAPSLIGHHRKSPCIELFHDQVALHYLLVTKIGQLVSSTMKGQQSNVGLHDSLTGNPRA